MSDRILRVNELIKRELGRILTLQGWVPEGALVSISRVEATPNLQQARIYITVFPAAKEKEALGMLRKEIYDIQQQLNKRLKMRPVPKIEMRTDSGETRAQRIREILDTIE